jgi:hypothetical protein
VKGTNQKCWDTSVSTIIVQGDVCFWNGAIYQYIGAATDVTRTDPTTNADYTVLPKSTTNGYIEEWDNVTYDPFNDDTKAVNGVGWIEKREDSRRNSISLTSLEESLADASGYSAVSIFQWGNDSWYANRVVSAKITQGNSRGEIYNNILNKGSYIYENPLAAGALIYNNIFTTNIGISGCTLAANAAIYDNIFTRDFQNKTINSGITYNNNHIAVTQDATETISANFENHTILPGHTTSAGNVDVTGFVSATDSTGYRLQSQDGTWWRVYISNTGVVGTATTTTP